MINIKSNKITPRFEKMRKNLSDEPIYRFINIGLEIVRSKITEGQDFPVSTGRLKSSLLNTNHQEHYRELRKENYVFIGLIGTKVPYARRIEFGFQGQDSLGRTYNQQGQYPMTKGFKLSKPLVAKAFVAFLKFVSSN